MKNSKTKRSWHKPDWSWLAGCALLFLPGSVVQAQNCPPIDPANCNRVANHSFEFTDPSGIGTSHPDPVTNGMVCHWEDVPQTPGGTPPQLVNGPNNDLAMQVTGVPGGGIGVGQHLVDRRIKKGRNYEVRFRYQVPAYSPKPVDRYKIIFFQGTINQMVSSGSFGGAVVDDGTNTIPNSSATNNIVPIMPGSGWQTRKFCFNALADADGVYVIVTNLSGDPEETFFQFDDLEIIDLTAGETACAGGQVGPSCPSVDLSGFNFTWNNGLPSIQNPTVNPTSTTNYIMTAVSPTGCVWNEQVTALGAATLNGPTNSCPGDVVTYTASVTNALSYSWVVNGLPVSNNNGPTLSMQPSVPQTVSISLTITFPTCSQTITKQLVVQAPPVLTAIATPPVVCAGQPTTLEVTSVSTSAMYGGAVWDGVHPDPYTVSPTTTTTYTASVTDQFGCVGETQVTVPVEQPINPVITTNATTLCENGTYVFSADLQGYQGNVTYQWTGSQGMQLNFATTEDVHVSFPNGPGNFVLTLNVTNACGTFSVGMALQVGQTPTITVLGPSHICVGSPIYLSALVTGGTVDWNINYGGNTLNLSGPNQTLTAGAYPNYNVTATVTNSSGCSNSDFLIIDVASARIPQASSPGVCKTGPLSFTDQNGCDPDYAYTWKSAGGTVLATTCNATFNVSPYSTITLETEHLPTGCTFTETIYIDRGPGAITGYTSHALIAECGPWKIDATLPQGIPPLSYAWSTGGTGSSINVSPMTATTYTVTITDSDGCSAVKSTQVDELPLHGPFSVVTPLNPVANTNLPNIWTLEDPNGPNSYTYNAFYLRVHAKKVGGSARFGSGLGHASSFYRSLFK